MSNQLVTILRMKTVYVNLWGKEKLYSYSRRCSGKGTSAPPFAYLFCPSLHCKSHHPEETQPQSQQQADCFYLPGSGEP